MTKHTLKVTNTHTLTQNIHIGAHTWQEYGYGDSDECNKTDNAYHTMCIKGTLYEDCSHSKNGDDWLPKISMLPDETLEIELELDLNAGNVTKDWALTAWGELGNVSVTMDGETTQHLPHIKEDGTVVSGPAPISDVNSGGGDQYEEDEEGYYDEEEYDEEDYDWEEYDEEEYDEEDYNWEEYDEEEYDEAEDDE